MEIIFNPQEEIAIQEFADKHNITYGEGLQRMIDAMTKGLIELGAQDGEFENIKRNVQTKLETLDNITPDSDNN